MIDENLTDKARKVLDARSLHEMRAVYGAGRITTHYLEPLGYWTPGSGTPKVVAEGPAVAQAMGRCATARVMKGDYAAALGQEVHPGECGWCAYPVPILLVACDHATWQSKCVDYEAEVWTFRHGREYVRSTGRSGDYDNPAWAAFFWGVTPLTENAAPSDLAHHQAARVQAIDAARGVSEYPERRTV